MDAARWSALNDLVGDALDLAPGERRAWIAAHAPDDALRAEAESLVAAHDRADTRGALASPFADRPLALPGRVGPWTPTARLGAGGMGVVYVAERAGEGFRQRAALKLVRPGFGADFRDRFVRERAVLAGLDHPGVARLLDGGLTDDGLPYLAMELVEGEPITTYAEHRALDVRTRAQLFVQACGAVAHAHRHLVVHRDLKPAHVLVVDDERGAPHVKLLDFGVAKLLDSEEPALTQPGSGPLTPQYAAPEQLAGEAVTTATDVYALGLVLYELVAGRRPYELAGMTASEAQAAVAEHRPRRPSAATGTTGARAGRGDLDTIVLKALAKDPTRRYPSADALADDLSRWLKGLPIAARPDSPGYRSRMFVRRHRTLVAAGAVALAALLGGAGLALWQARAAAIERDRAEGRFEIAREAARALIYEVHDAVAALDGSTGAREIVLARSIDYLDRLAADAADDPALRVDLAEAYFKVGSVQGLPNGPNLGRTRDAEASYRRGLALLPADTPPADSLGLRALRARAHLLQKLAVVRAFRGDTDDARGLLAEAVAAYDRVHAVAPGTADQQADRVSAFIESGDYAGHPHFPSAGDTAAATAYYDRAEAAVDAIAEPDRTPHVRRMRSVVYERQGTMRYAAGDLDGALDRYLRSLAIREALAAEPGASYDARRDGGVAHEMIGRTRRQQGRPAEALAAYRRALAVYATLAREDPANAGAQRTLAIGHWQVATPLAGPDGPNLGRRAEALREIDRALALLRPLAADDDSGVESLIADIEADRRALAGG